MILVLLNKGADPSRVEKVFRVGINTHRKKEVKDKQLGNAIGDGSALKLLTARA